MKIESTLQGVDVEVWTHGRYTVWICRHNTFARIYPSLDDMIKGEVLRELHTDFEEIVVEKSILSDLYRSENYNYKTLKETCEIDLPKPMDVIFHEKEETIHVVTGVFRAEEKVIVEDGKTFRYSDFLIIRDRKTLQSYFERSERTEISVGAIELIINFQTNLRNVPKRKSTVYSLLTKEL